MRKGTALVWAAVAAIGLAVLAGCGGGSGSGSGSMGLYVMDGFSDEYAQVWASLYRIEVGSGGVWTTIYDEAEGAELNLPELADTAAFLGTANVPARRFDRARLTIRNAMRLVGRDGVGADVPLHLSAANGFRAGAGDRCTVEFPIDCTVTDGGNVDLAIDFDLPNFARVGAQVQARVQQGDANRFRAMRKNGRLLGVVANLDASGFYLTLRSGRIVRVALTDATVIARASTGADVALANGQTVFVTGVWDASAGVLTAGVVLVVDVPIGVPRPAHVRGTVISVDEADRSFVMEPFNAFMNFRPTADKVKVLTTDSTVFGFIPRAPAAFSDVTVGAKVDVIGAKEPASETITARRVLIVR
jgi:hypothetical protein